MKGQAGALVRADRPTLSTGDIGGLRTQARAALDSVGERLDAPAGATHAEPAGFDEAPEPGTRVLVASFGGAEGIVRGASGRQIDVEVRGKRMRVGLKDLRRLQATGGRPQAGSSGARPAARVMQSASTGALVPVTRDLVVVGATVDEAIDRAEKFLDTAILNDERRLRVVHGHGTGRLREALREYFKTHPLVAGVSAASDSEGGGAATIVDLKE